MKTRNNFMLPLSAKSCENIMFMSLPWYISYEQKQILDHGSLFRLLPPPPPNSPNFVKLFSSMIIAILCGSDRKLYPTHCSVKTFPISTDIMRRFITQFWNISLLKSLSLNQLCIKARKVISSQILFVVQISAHILIA